MKRVAIYVRSSKDLHDVSCEAQERQIREAILKNGDVVYGVFEDKALSSTRDVRPAFDEMITLAKGKPAPFEKIYCLDTSRFGRDQLQTQTYLWMLRKKYGIEVKFLNMPDTGTHLDGLLESIMTSFDEFHSKQSKVKGVAGMKQNILNGYRAGGPPPYGYKLEDVEIAKHRFGDTVTKTRLVPDPQTARVIQEYFNRRARYEPRTSILQDFQRRGIPTPHGNENWSITTAKSWEDNVDVYLGHLFFNRLNERMKAEGHCEGFVGGKKWKPKEEWIIKNNAHEPLITEDIAGVIREIRERGLREESCHATRTYSLSGILKCAKCGTNYTGDRGLYRCNSISKTGGRCGNNDIVQGRVEQAILEFIRQRVLRFKDLKRAIERVKMRFKTGEPEIDTLEKRLSRTEREMKRLVDLYRREIIDAETIESEMRPLREQKESMLSELGKSRMAKRGLDLTDDDLKKGIEHLSEKLENADPKIKKRAVQALLDEVRIYPKEGKTRDRLLEIIGVYFPLVRVNVVVPTGLEPVLPT